MDGHGRGYMREVSRVLNIIVKTRRLSERLLKIIKIVLKIVTHTLYPTIHVRSLFFGSSGMRAFGGWGVWESGSL